MARGDPRGSSRYQRTRAEWKPQAPDRCCLCGGRIDKTLPARHRNSWTVEHRLPIRHILTMTQTWAEAVAMACDVSLWDSAHKRCQDQQGGEATRGTKLSTGPRSWGE